MKKLLLFSLLGCALQSHALTRTVLVNNGNWFTPATWSGNAVPGATDTVVIPAGIKVVLNLPSASVQNTPWNNPIKIAVWGTFEMKGTDPLFSNPVTIEVFSGGAFIDHSDFSEFYLTPVSRWIMRMGSSYTGYFPFSNILNTSGGTPPNFGMPNPTVPPFTLTVSPGVINYSPTVVPLPLKLIRFSGRKVAGGVALEWTTAAEDRTGYFDVERSGSGKFFDAIGRVKAAGGIENHYEATDNAPAQGMNLYRLKMTDADGSYTYSPVVSLFGDATGTTVYPNPAGGALYVSSTEEQAAVISNIAGQVVQTGKVSKGTTVLDIRMLPDGVYYLQLGSQHIRFIKARP